MILNHLNLAVTDAGEAADFLVRYFGMRREPGGNKNFVVLRDDADIVLTLMKDKRTAYPGNFHIGFIQESEAEVDALNQRLRADGFDVAPPERHHAWTFYVEAPGGITVEVLA